MGLPVVVNGHVSRLSGCRRNSTGVRGSFLQMSKELNGWSHLPLDVNGQLGGHVSGCQWACEWGIFALHQATLARPAVGV